MPHTFDATLKDILAQSPADLRKPFHLPATEPAIPLNVDLSTISAATDVAFGYGDPLQEIVDLNLQSGPDAKVAARSHLYNAALHLKYSVPVRSVLVLLRSKAGVPGLNGKLSYVVENRRVIFEYDVIRLWKQPVELFLEGGLGLLPLAPLCKMPSGKPLDETLRIVVREIDRRLASVPDHSQAVRLMTAAFVLTGIRIPKETRSHVYEGVRIMHELTAYEEIEEAEIRMSKKMLFRQGRKRFGDPDRKSETALNRIPELSRLERMIDAILEVSSWKELLAVK